MSHTPSIAEVIPVVESLDLNLNLYVAIQLHISLCQLLHHRRYGGRTCYCHAAACLAACECRSRVVDGDVSLIAYNLLSLCSSGYNR